MKKRKNVLTVMAVLYIFAAVGAVAVFLRRPVDTKGGGNMPGHNDSGALVTATVGTHEETEKHTVTQDISDEKSSDGGGSGSEQETARKDGGEEKEPGHTEYLTQEDTNMPTSQLWPRTEEDTKAPDSPLLDGEYAVMYRAVSRRGAVNMRKAPDNSGSVVFCIPKDGECEVLLDDVEGWMLVRYRGYTGFVYESYLEEV